MSRFIKAQLENLKHGEINPSEEWLTSNRALLLSQIKNTVTACAPAKKFTLNNIWSAFSIFLPQTFVLNVVRPIAVLLIVALVGTSGWIATVDASYESLPGEWLYSAKRAVEKTQVTIASVTGNQKAETQLHADFAKRRATEVKKIVTTNANPNADTVAAVVRDLKTEIQSVNTKLDEIKADPSAQKNVSAAAVQDLKNTTEEVQAVLGSVKDNLQTISSTTAAINQTVAEAKDLVKDTAVKAVETMVVQHLDGDTSVTKEEVKKELNKTLNSAASDIVSNQQNVVGVKTIVDAVATEIGDLVKESRSASSIITTSTTKDLSEKIVEIASTTKAATVQTDAAAVAGDKKIAEAKMLIGQDDLTGAIGKVKELTAVAKEAEKIKDTALQTVQNVLPIVSVVKDASVLLSSSSTMIDVKIGTSSAFVSTATATPVATSEIKILIAPTTSLKK